MKTDIAPGPDAAFEDFPVPNRNREVEERARRLRVAVKQAGGNHAVAARARIPLGTLNNYVAGRDMKAGALVGLADACGVSIEWLATGRGTMRPSDSPPAPPPQLPPAPPKDGRPLFFELFGTLDMDRMGKAMEIAIKAFSERRVSAEWRRLAQVSALIYDTLGDPQKDPDALARELSFRDHGP